METKEIQIRGTPRGYGLMSSAFQRGMVAANLALFGLGWWMVAVDYH